MRARTFTTRPFAACTRTVAVAKITLDDLVGMSARKCVFTGSFISSEPGEGLLGGFDGKVEACSSEELGDRCSNE